MTFPFVVTMPICRPLLSLLTTTGTGLEMLEAKVVSCCCCPCRSCGARWTYKNTVGACGLAAAIGRVSRAGDRVVPFGDIVECTRGTRERFRGRVAALARGGGDLIQHGIGVALTTVSSLIDQRHDGREGWRRSRSASRRKKTEMPGGIRSARRRISGRNPIRLA